MEVSPIMVPLPKLRVLAALEQAPTAGIMVARVLGPVETVRI